MENIYFKPVNLLKTELDNFKNGNINTYNLVEKDKNYSKSLLPFVKFRVIFQLNSLSENIFHFYVKCNIDSISILYIHITQKFTCSSPFQCDGFEEQSYDDEVRKQSREPNYLQFTNYKMYIYICMFHDIYI